MTSIPCPHCGRTLSIPDDAAGKNARCTKCKQVFRIPTPAPPEPEEPAGQPEPSGQERERPGNGEKRRRKKKKPAVYVEVDYPARLGILSFAWALVGWLLAALAPHLAFVPLVGVLNYALPSVTVGLIGANLYFAVRNLWRGAHPLCLLLVTGLQMALFTTLFFQLFAHLGADLYDVQGPTSAWQWVGFSLAHALRAWDVLDIIEAFSMKVQVIKHDGWLVAVFVILYHLVVDAFFLGVVWDVVERIKRDLLRDEGIRDLVRKVLITAFAVWLIAWVVIAFGVHHWSPIDVPLWFAENVLRVFDFADVMESFNLSLHGLPREGLTGTLTLFCRLWVAVGIGLLLGRKKKAADRRVATPPYVDAFPYWAGRAGILAAGLLVVLGAGLLWQAVLANPLPGLTAAAGGPSDDRAAAALGALRRMGPTAGAAIDELVKARPTASAATRDEITRTLGHLGTDAINPLAEIALREPEPAAKVAVESLGQIRPEAAPALVKVWSATPSEAVRRQAAAELGRFGSEAVPPLMNATTAANAEAHNHWFAELDRNWTLRGTSNKLAKAIQKMPDLIRQLKEDPDAATTIKVLEGLKECGSAAKAAMPLVLDRLQSRDPKVREKAAPVLVAIGPAATPELLRRLNFSADTLDGDVLGILSDARMWDEAALKDPAAVPALAKLVGRTTDISGGVRNAAIRALAQAGPTAKAAVPSLMALLVFHLPDQRALAREALGKIDPDWKNRPDNGRVILPLLPRLADLPPQEADELLAALGDLKESDADALIGVLTAGVRPSDEKKYRNAVFGVLDRLGPRRVAAVLPALTRMLSDPKAHFGARLRLVASLKNIAPDLGPDLVAAVMTVLGTDEEGMPFLRENYPKTKEYIDGLLRDREPKKRLAGVRAVNAIGAPAKDHLPLVIACLPDKNEGMQVNKRPVNSRMFIVETLNALDRDWARDPVAVKALMALVANINADFGQSRRQVLQILTDLGPAAKPLVPDLAKLLLAQDNSFDEDMRKLLDRIDPDWRKHPVIQEIVPELVKRLEKGAYVVADRALRHLGPAAVPELQKVLPGADPDFRKRIVAVLGTAGGAAKEAVPAVLKEVVNPKLSWEETRRLMASLASLDPDWASQSKVKELIPGLLAEVARQPSPAARYSIIATAIGAGAVPEAIKLLGSDKAEQRGAGLVALRDIGPAARDALPAVEKTLKDRDAQVRQTAVEAVSRIGRGSKDLLVVLAPSLFDENSNVQMAALGAMGTVDRDWRKAPQFKAVVALVLKNLSNADPKRRYTTLWVLEQIGPAEGVVPALEEMVKGEKDPRTLRQAQWLLDQRRRGQ
jgi:HEAT repeat protein